MFKRKSTTTNAMCMYFLMIHKNLNVLEKKTNQKTKKIQIQKFNKTGPCKNKCSRIKYWRVVLNFLECSHCLRRTICSREEHQNNCNVHVCLMLHTKHHNNSKRKNKKQKQTLKIPKIRKIKRKYTLLENLLCKG